MYGAETCGVADSMLHRQRVVAAANACAPGAGKQLDASLFLADIGGKKTDPAFAAHELPLGALAKAAWQRWWTPLRSGPLTDGSTSDPSDGLAEALSAAYGKLRGAVSPWPRVTGPFAAAAATATRLGWEHRGGLAFVTQAGDKVSMVRDSPAAVAVHVKRAVQRWRSRILTISTSCQSRGLTRLLRPAKQCTTAFT